MNESLAVEAIKSLRNLVDYADILIASFDQDLKYIHINQKYAQSFHKTIDEIEGQKVADILPESLFKKHLPYAQKCLNGETVTFESYVDLPTGRIYSAGCYFPVKNEQGEVIQAVVTVHDVTEKKQSNEELQRTTDILHIIQTHLLRLFESDKTPSQIHFCQTLLQQMGETLNVSRVYIFDAYQTPSNDYLIKQTHEWVADAIPPQIENPTLQNVALSSLGLSDWETKLKNGEIINELASHACLLPKAVMEAQQIKTIIWAPIFVNGQWRGFLGFDDCQKERKWSDIEISALQTCANAISSTLGYQELQKAKQAADHEAELIEKRINDALESAEHGVWEWDLRTDTVYYSDILQKQLGYQPGEFTDALEEWSGRVHPDDMEKTYAAVQAHLAGEIPEYRAEFRMRKKDGSYAWMLAIAKAKKDAQGNPIKLGGTHTDLTPQKTLEAQLERQRLIQMALINGIPDLVWLKDQDGVYLEANKRFEDFFGHPQEIIMGKTDYDFVDKDLADFFRENDKKAIAIGAPSVNEETITFANDGHQEVLETIKTPIHLPNGDLLGVLGVGRDVTQRKQTEEQLKLSASVFSNAHDGILICDANANIVDVNPAFEGISGYSKSDVLGRNPRFLSSGKQSATFYRKMWQDMIENGFWQGELWNQRKDGQLYAILTNISSIQNHQGEITHYLAIFSDITHIKHHQEELEQMAHYDALTGLPNRVLLADRLQQAILHADRHSRTLAVCFLDLDNFKPINDNFGHATGDRVLQAISKKLKQKLRAEDTLSRIGGDEFIILLNDYQNTQDIQNIAAKILALVTEPIQIENQDIILSASMGITLYPQDYVDADVLIRHADQAMYEAKLLGKNRFHFFDPSATHAYQQLNQSISEIQRAMAEDHFELHYQPKVNLLDNQVTGFEALIRWLHPIEGMLFPDSFLPSIDGHALSSDLDLWVLDQAMKQLLKWHETDLNNLSISINISPMSLLHHDFAQKVYQRLQAYPCISPNLLEIEILETTSFKEIEQAQITLTELRSFGIAVALDDFGTGASSLSYLKQLPADSVKIDRSFIADIMDDANDLAIVEGVVHLAKAFKLNVIAEGVENEAIAQKLYDLGCYYVQGYWIAKPLPKDQIEGFMLDWQQRPKLNTSPM